jgi:hypothetical protein
MGVLVAALSATAMLALTASPASALEGGAAMPEPVVVVANTRFFPMLEGIVLAPGERAHRDLNLSHFTRVSLLAAAGSGPNQGRVAVITAFGPPAVPVPNRLDLVFDGGTAARRGDTLAVMGPRLRVEVVNVSRQPVELSVSAYASK